MRKHITNHEELQRLRESKGMTPAGLAEKVGISLDLLYRIENGSRQTSTTTLGRLADALGVEPAKLLIPIPAGATRPRRGQRSDVVSSDAGRVA